ncbi:putative DNA-binding domain-containing protein [Ralstonia pseudosolanacearum]
MRLHDWEARLVGQLTAAEPTDATDTIDAIDETRGVAVYRNARRAILRNALAGAYPVCRALVGEDCFDALVQGTLLAQPSRSPNLHHYGDALPAVIARSPLADSVPYLADVATLEWRVHWAHYAPDAAPDVPDAQALGRLLAQPPEQIQAGLAAGAWLVRSPWPVVSIWRAHQPGATVRLGDIALAGSPEAAVVTVRAQRVVVLDIDAATATFLAACEASDSLDAAVTRTLADLPAFDLSASLATLYRAGLLRLRARPSVPARDPS